MASFSFVLENRPTRPRLWWAGVGWLAASTA